MDENIENQKMVLKLAESSCFNGVRGNLNKLTQNECDIFEAVIYEAKKAETPKKGVERIRKIIESSPSELDDTDKIALEFCNELLEDMRTFPSSVRDLDNYSNYA